jgi:predicted O-methyltransferase YrrM
MASTMFQQVDSYLEQLLGDDPALSHALSSSDRNGLPAIQVSALQGRLLTLIAQIAGARRILEVGTLGGYSTICLARGMRRDGVLITLELEPHHAAVARENLEFAKLAAHVDVIEGKALHSLVEMIETGSAPFDVVFIDANKDQYPEYLESVLQLTREGSVIVLDNVIRAGAIKDDSSDDPSVIGVQKVLAQIAGNPKLFATAIQTVGAKGHDGFALARVIG